jgi:hypothetical protein
VNENIEFGLVDSQSVAVEALCFHEPVKILDQERIVNRCHHLDVAMMPRAKVGGQTTCRTHAVLVERGHSHPLVVQALREWVSKLVESLKLSNFNDREFGNFLLSHKRERHARNTVLNYILIDFKHPKFKYV